MLPKQFTNIDKAAAVSVGWLTGSGFRHSGHCFAPTADGAVHDIGRLLFRTQQPGAGGAAAEPPEIWVASDSMAGQGRH